jgi:hypothetical protein
MTDVSNFCKTTFSIQINHPIVKQLIDAGLTPAIVYEPSYGPAIVEFVVTQEEKVNYIQRCVSAGAHHKNVELDQVSTRVKTI